MIFHIICGASSKFFTSILDSLKYSLIDLGYKEGTVSDSDLIIGIKSFHNTIKKAGKKYWLIQTEYHSSDKIKEVLDFKPDRIFGFNIDSKEEEYLPIGYHKKLEITNDFPIKGYPICLIGTDTPRRIEFKNKVKNKFEIIREWNYVKKISLSKNSIINLNLHSYNNNKGFTEWERLATLISNRCFFISEEMYCPVKGLVYCNQNNYDQVVEQYLSSTKLRKEVVNSVYYDYVNNFDMRKILEEKLK